MSNETNTTESGKEEAAAQEAAKRIEQANRELQQREVHKRMMDRIADHDLENRFTYHPPDSEEKIETYDKIRRTGLAFARLVNELVKSPWERALAITKIEEAVMHANVGVARFDPIDEVTL